LDDPRAQDQGETIVAVKLRLMRMGKTKQPTYRLVAADSRSPRDGRFIEILGVYAPRGRSTSDPDAVVEIDNDKALKWLRQGAQATDRVQRLLKTSGAWDQFRGDPATSEAAK
jgi:small subunit ribosomal protein S16